MLNTSLLTHICHAVLLSIFLLSIIYLSIDIYLTMNLFCHYCLFSWLETSWILEIQLPLSTSVVTSWILEVWLSLHSFQKHLLSTC